ncbi:hypothetical protein HanHA300_Chr14g0531021 [Helianthus annuus]|nr:hypothetical protein HanHA300_Chr14g0531021 [Helianthus annuus]KAJ0486367.1 hypothetical protein HanHA89_Chr14g0578901 [Helianthus annuus]KAJ0656920.1 hypothetical protein HanLR1_Chr14g0541331 [Helianthus annuus]
MYIRVGPRGQMGAIIVCPPLLDSRMLSPCILPTFLFASLRLFDVTLDAKEKGIFVIIPNTTNPSSLY